MKNFLALINKIPVVPLLIALFAGMFLGDILLFLTPLFSYKPVYLLFFLAAGILFLFMMVNPRALLIVIFVTRPMLDNVLNETRLGGGGIGFGAILNLLIIVLGVILYFQSRPPSIPKQMMKAWVVFLFFMFLAVCYSPYWTRAIRLFLNHGTYLAMFVLPFLLIRSKKDLEYWFSLLILSFIPPIIIGDIDFVHGGRMTSDAGNRIFGTFSHPNILAFYLVLSLTATTIYIMRYWKNLNKPKRAGLVLLVSNIIFLLLAAKTRNAWLAAVVLFGLYGFLKDRKMLVTIIILAVCSLFAPPVQERLQDIFAKQQDREYQGLNSLDWRLEMWKSSIPMIEKQPWFGYGLTSFKPMTEKFSNVGENGAHNVYLELMFESGIGGVLSFLALLIAPAVWFFKRMRLEADPNVSKILCFIGAYVISYIINCIADNMLYYLVLNWYVWFFIGLMMVWYQLREKDVKI